jgi:Calcineurin-like phosphoesterase superfamily domain
MGSALLLVALVFGVTTASVEQGFGPHEARYSVTTDDLVTLDLGPLGTVEIASPLPLTLGARVTVEEIPSGVTAVDPARTVQMLSQDLQGYVQFFTGPRATIEDASRALVYDALRRTLLAFVGLLAVVVVLGALLGRARRAELAAAVGPHRRDAGLAAVLAGVVAVTCVSSVDATVREGQGRRASSVFDGTALEGARITGRLAGVIDTYGTVVVDAYRRNETFYETAEAAVGAAWDQRALAQQVLAPSGDRSDGGGAGEEAADDAGDGVDDGAAAADGAGADRAEADPDAAEAGADGAEADADGSEADADPDADPGAGATPDPEPTEDPVEPVVMVLVADLHCNIGMARIIRTVAERSGAALVLNAGDTTVNGTSVERYCVSTFAQALPPGVPGVVADGNHDSIETAEQERRAGWTVLDGGVVTAAGVRILGDRDPNQTQIGAGTAQISEETAAEAGARLAEAACDAGDVDILLIHNPRVGDDAMRSGCVPVQLSGHQHRRTGPIQVGDGIRYVNASTAGAASGRPTIGPLGGVAELTVLRFDPESRRVIDTQLVSVAPDGSATVAPREPFPAVVPTDAGEADGVGPSDGTSDDAEGRATEDAGTQGRETDS